MENLEPYVRDNDIKVQTTTTILLSDRDYLKERGIPITAAINIGCKELRAQDGRPGNVSTMEQLQKVAAALNQVAQEKTAIEAELAAKIREEVMRQ